jgi:hypothetical protein
MTWPDRLLLLCCGTGLLSLVLMRLAWSRHRVEQRRTLRLLAAMRKEQGTA